MSELVEDLIDGYLDRMSRAAEAYHNEPWYHAQLTWMRRTLGLADMAMQDRGVPEEDRRYVLTVAVYGSPDEDAAMAKIAERKRLIEEYSRQMPNFTATVPPLTDDSWIKIGRLERPTK